MKLTPSVYNWMLREMYLRCEQMGITEPPKLIVRTVQVLAMPIEHTVGRRSSASRHYGVCYTKANTIFINVRSKHHKSRAMLRDTLIHELVHYRFEYLQHSPKFRQRVQEIIKGKWFAPKKDKIK